MLRIVCYGDSNTYGYDAADVFGGRLPSEQRWTDLLAKQLNADVVNCGMNGRTVPKWQRELEADLRLLSRAAPFDVLTVMLGSNDLLLEREPEAVADQMKSFLSRVRCQYPSCKIVLIAPPPVCGFELLFSELSRNYAALSKALQVYCVDASEWHIDLSHDDVHFSPAGHVFFANKMCEMLERMLS